MNDIEQKALALLNESGWKGAYLKRAWNCRYEALCRAIEQHEAFRRDVSDAVEDIAKRREAQWLAAALGRFIIPKPVDPLAEVIATALRDGSPFDDDGSHDYTAEAACILSAMKARGYQFTKIGEGA